MDRNEPKILIFRGKRTSLPQIARITPMFFRRAASFFILTQRHSVSRSFSLLLTGCTDLPDHHPIGM